MLFSLTCSPLVALAANEPQFQLGDTLSLFSDKAIRKDGGDIFEAVGNVVILSGKDTLYGESAHFDRKNMIFTVEGNVRLISNDITLYGSRLEYQALSGYAEVDNARIVSPRFTLVARKIMRRAEKVYVTEESEFSSCRDCPESWSVFGKRIVLYMDDRAEIHHGLAKVKGISVLYLPYMVIPLQARKSGLLVPDVFTRLGEGLGVAQPVFWAIDPSKDATITPTFWATRGYGGDVEYRQRFGPERWFQGNARVLNDKIYLPAENNQGESGSNYTRYFSDLENHWQWNPNWTHHLRDTSTRDLDIVRDHPAYTDNRVIGSNLGFQGHVDGRGERWALSAQSEYYRNQLYAVPDGFDNSYVQTVPRVALGAVPYSLIQSKVPFFQHIMIGADGSFTRFRQLEPQDALSTTGPIRNADRLTANPYVNWHFFTWGPLALKGQATLDYQRYNFNELTNAQAEKSAVMLKTEASFTMDRIFGLAYEEKVPLRELPSSMRKKLAPVQDKGIKALTSGPTNKSLVGTLPDFNTSLTNDNVPIARHAYRHSQEFKFIHHYITSENLSGNTRFTDQIRSNTGWFDYTDAIRSQEYLLGANITRTIVPPNNTLEFQWNNVLIKKAPQQNTDWRQDQRYLRDNFSYSKIGYFNVSQGYIFDTELRELRERLTRLYINTGYTAEKWSINASEYFFHLNSQHIFQLGWQRQFDYLNLLSAYNYNSFGSVPLHTLSAGLQVRPMDTLGLSYMKLVDLEAKEDIRNMYSVDIMPNNECWILSLNYRESLVGYQVGFNVQFNFGDERFQDYRKDWFRLQRFQQR